MHIRWLVIPLLLSTVVACAGQPGVAPTGQGSAPTEVPQRTLVVATDASVDGFGEMFAGGKSGAEELQAIVHRVLAEADDKGTYVPGVAARLPSLDDGSWRLLPDGGSETTWTLRSNARWHDGTLVSSDDVLFSWQVAVAPDVPDRSRQAAQQIAEVQVVDAQTVTIRWKTVFVGAGRLAERDLYLLPRHILEPAFLGDRTAFVNSSYWTSAYVGTGPYRVTLWEPGSHANVEAYDGFYGEKPRIKNIVFRTIPDVTAGVANIRAGEVDVWLGSSFGLEHARSLKDEWEAAGGGQVITYPRLVFEIRFRPDDPKVGDVRVRRALAHAMDREGIVRDLYFGLLRVAHTFVAPGTSGFEQIEPRLMKYPYDLNRAYALLGELGWSRGSDGRLRNERGEPYAMEFSTTSNNREREELQAVIADMWKTAGFEITFDNVPLTVQSDPSYVFSTTDLSGISTDFEANMPRFDGRNRRTPQNPRGANVWGYSNAEVDRLIDEWNRTLDRPRQIEVEAAALQKLSEDLAILPINYRIEAITASKGLVGVPPRSSVQSATNTWNVETWYRAS
jgi:peptide/nickel transport system substrate-binding protein